MKRGNPISIALHLLVHLASSPDLPVTSAQLAECWRTNPVVIRRLLADLRRAGLVRSTPGHGGGWLLTRAAEAITVREIYAALGVRALAPPATESPGCLLEAAVNRALTDVYGEVEAMLAERLAGITLAELYHELATHAPTRIPQEQQRAR